MILKAKKISSYPLILILLMVIFCLAFTNAKVAHTNCEEKTHDTFVRFYVDCGYNNQFLQVRATPFAANIATNNDVLSSITVPAGYVVVLYEHANLGGASVAVGTNHCLVDEGWNDRVSSYKIVAW